MQMAPPGSYREPPCSPPAKGGTRRGCFLATCLGTAPRQPFAIPHGRTVPLRQVMSHCASATSRQGGRGPFLISAPSSTFHAGRPRLYLAPRSMASWHAASGFFEGICWRVNKITSLAQRGSSLSPHPSPLQNCLPPCCEHACFSLVLDACFGGHALFCGSVCSRT